MLSVRCCAWRRRRWLLTNGAFHQLLRDGLDVEYARPDGSTKHDKTLLVGFSAVRANDWLAVNRFTVIEGQFNQRTDIVVFTTSHKCMPEKGEEMPELSAWQNIVVIAVVAHLRKTASAHG